MAITANDHFAVERQARARVESELAAELARRDLTRVRVDDQPWIHELVGRVVGEEQRRAVPAMHGEESQQLLRRIFAAVTPLAQADGLPPKGQKRVVVDHKITTDKEITDYTFYTVIYGGKGGPKVTEVKLDPQTPIEIPGAKRIMSNAVISRLVG